MQQFTLLQPFSSHPPISPVACSVLHQRQPESMGAPEHCPLGRILSAPPPISNQQLFGGQMFAPSTAVWGRCEFSLSGLGVPMPQFASNQATAEPIAQPLEQQRRRLQYHLSRLFPEATVLAVMAAHPRELDAQRLCQRIIDFRKGFQPQQEEAEQQQWQQGEEQKRRTGLAGLDIGYSR
jgi:hypothetical protein